MYVCVQGCLQEHISHRLLSGHTCSRLLSRRKPTDGSGLSEVGARSSGPHCLPQTSLCPGGGASPSMAPWALALTSYLKCRGQG